MSVHKSLVHMAMMLVVHQLHAVSSACQAASQIWQTRLALTAALIVLVVNLPNLVL